MARRMTLPGPSRGPWQVTHESGRNAVVAQTTWSTVLRHPSGWQVVYDEADRLAVLVTPADEVVLTLDVPPQSSDVVGHLVQVAEDWIAVNAAARGLPDLQP